VGGREDHDPDQERHRHGCCRQEAQLGEHAGVRGMAGNRNLAPFICFYIFYLGHI
jgi:hypothetical protein